jgi:two-component sensor histidine kinase
MIEFFSKLLNSDFMPHGHCFLWLPEILFLHVISDLTIFIAYFSIPIILVTVIQRRPDIGYNSVFFWSASFIFACGLTHLMEIWSVWNGTYRLTGLLKAITAIISIGAAFTLWRHVPTIAKIRTPVQAEEHDKRLMKVNKNVEKLIESKNQQYKEIELQRLLLDELDHRVKNMLAVVLSISKQTLQTSSSIDLYQQSFIGRIKNLAQIQQILIKHSWQCIPLRQIILSSVTLYRENEDEGFRIKGENIVFNSDQVQALHIIFYELATNCSKYGAFKDLDSELDVSWFMKQDQKIEIIWKETRKTFLSAPDTQGFGTRIIHLITTQQLKGEVQWEYKDYILQCILKFPLLA